MGRLDAVRATLADMLRLLGFTSGLLALHVYGRVLTDGVVVALMAGLGVVAGHGLFRRARARREVLATAFLAEGSWLRGWYRGGALLWLVCFVVGLGAAMVLVAGVVRLGSERAWWVLAAMVVALPLGYHGLLRVWPARHLNARYGWVVCWRACLWVALVLLVAGFTGVAFHEPVPALAEVSLMTALDHGAAAERAASGLLEVLLQLSAMKEGAALWAVQHLVPSMDHPVAAALIWAVALAPATLLVGAYLLCASGAILVLGGAPPAFEAGGAG